MEAENKSGRYDYMLNMPHHKSKKHKPMAIADRAAQFGAFRALTGYEDAIEETARLTESRIELDEYEKVEIDGRLREINERIESIPEVTVTYFVADERKSGGKYVVRTGNVCKIFENERTMVFTDGLEIPIDEIAKLYVNPK